MNIFLIILALAVINLVSASKTTTTLTTTKTTTTKSPNIIVAASSSMKLLLSSYNHHRLSLLSSSSSKKLSSKINNAFIGVPSLMNKRMNSRRGRKQPECYCYHSLSSSSLSLSSKSLPFTSIIGGERVKSGGFIPQKVTTKTTTTSLFSSIINDHEEDTIYALSSGGGFGLSGGSSSAPSVATAVAVIRLTGAKSHDVLRILLDDGYNNNDDDDDNKEKKMLKKQLPFPKARRASLRTLYDPFTTIVSSSSSSLANNLRRVPLDSALILTFSGPKSFTGEDMVEIHCHGSRAVVRGLLETLSKLSLSSSIDTTKLLLPSLNLRPAERGEFAHRAHTNAKLDLLGIEALADLVSSETSLQRVQALNALGTSNGKSGNSSRQSLLYNKWRGELISGLAHAEALIDFGDDEDLDEEGDEFSSIHDNLQSDGSSGISNGNGSGAGDGVWEAIRPKINKLLESMEKHLGDSNRGEILRDGVRVAIVGPPNSGKVCFYVVISFLLFSGFEIMKKYNLEDS